MPERYVPVPYRALELADHEEWFAVLDLYKRAHSLRWAPFRVTERSLATKWRLGNRRLWSLLEQLEEQGLLTIRKGCNRTPTLVTVLCPTGEGPQSGGVQQSEQRTARQSGQRTGQQNNTDDNGVVGIHAAQVAAQDAAQPPAQAAENLLRPETSTETR
nr:hypothetical protein [Anaerolineae bacterium]